MLIGVISILLVVNILDGDNKIVKQSYALSNLYDAVKNSAKVSTYSGSHADTVDNNGNEIVGSKAIYYYNTAGYNNVKFGDFCWKIIRTTDTGGVKLLYNGEYNSSTKCNNIGVDRAIRKSIFNSFLRNRIYVGYKYKTTDYNDTDSIIKTYIDNWYNHYMTNYSSYLEDVVFCNDRTGSTNMYSAATGTTWGGDSSTSAFYYHNHEETSYTKLSCSNVKDRFTTNNVNAKLDYPIALITLPEHRLLDSETKIITTSFQSFTISPDMFWLYEGKMYASMIGRYTTQYGHVDVTNPSFVSPSISLKPNIQYTTGTGTVSNPYEIDVELPEEPTPVRQNSYLYDAVKQDAEEANLGDEYTDEHADTVEDDGTPIIGNKKIYSYYVPGHNNVKFGDYCWQIVRTTDTGGVRIIYNGVYSSSTKCNNSGNDSQIGTSAFNTSNNDIKYVGYKYASEGTNSLEQSDYTSVSNSSSYPYSWSDSNKKWTSSNHSNSSSSTITFKVKTAGDYKLNYTVSSESNYDKAYFYKNNSAICSSSSGISGSTSSSCDLNGLTTSDTIKVTYTKDSSQSSGNDNVVFYLTTSTSASYNAIDSTIKTYIDNWYESNMTSLTSKLEDTVFCNDRTGGTDIDDNVITGTTWYEERTSDFNFHNTYWKQYSKLSCSNVKDRFTTNNVNAKLTYPVGLISAPEVYLLSPKSLKTGNLYWTISPSDSSRNRYIAESGNIYSDQTSIVDCVDNVYGVRPVVSLVPNIKYTSGTGSTNDPYIIKTTNTITATIYYQSSSTSGAETIASKEVECETTSDSCSVEIPSEVRESVGKYNNSYAGLSTETGTMSTSGGASKNDTSITITDDTSFYATYSSSVTNYYYSD